MAFYDQTEKVQEKAQERQFSHERGQQANLADLSRTGGRPTLWGPDPNRAGGIADRRAGLAALAGRELGEPSSFAGGAGAPAPGTPGNVEVIRGGQRTYASPAAGGQEFLTPLQAQQAYNRTRLQGSLADIANKPVQVPAGSTPEQERGRLVEMAHGRYGEYRAPGQTLEETKAMKEGPGASAERFARARLFDVTRQKEELGLRGETERKNMDEFDTGFKNRYGKQVPHPTIKGKFQYDMPDDPFMLEAYQHARDIARVEGPKAGHDFMESLVTRHYDSLFTPQNIASLRPYLAPHEQALLTPEALKRARSNPAAWKEVLNYLGPKMKKISQDPYAGVTPDPFVQ